jgi:prolyl-tRNA synthetase
VYSYLPLGWAVLKRIEEIIREEMDREGGQEIHMPSVLPVEYYQQSGRDQTMADILFRLKDHREREFFLGPTHEEIFVEVFKRNVRSYRDMPLLVPDRAEVPGRAAAARGLVRLREFTMKDAYSFDPDWEALDVSYAAAYDAYVRIFERANVPVLPVEADPGANGGKDSQEFLYLTPGG